MHSWDNNNTEKYLDMKKYIVIRHVLITIWENLLNTVRMWLQLDIINISEHFHFYV